MRTNNNKHNGKHNGKHLHVHNFWVANKSNGNAQTTLHATRVSPRLDVLGRHQIDLLQAFHDFIADVYDLFGVNGIFDVGKQFQMFFPRQSVVQHVVLRAISHDLVHGT